MKHLRIFSIFALATLVFFSSSCTKVNSETGQEKIDEATTSIIDEINMATTSDVFSAFTGIITLGDEPFKTTTFKDNAEAITKIGKISKDFLNKYISKVGQLKIGSTEFEFSKYCGTYTWNAANEEWDYVSSPSDKIIIKFPSQGMNINNCTFELSQYKETYVSLNEEYYPTIIDAKLTMNDEEVASLELEMSYDQSANPTNADLKLFVDPFKLTLDYKLDGTEMSVKSELKAKGYVKESVETKLTFTKYDDGSLDEVIAGDGTVKIYKFDNNMINSVVLKIKYDFDYTSIYNQENITCADINENTNIVLYTSANRKIGHVECTDDDCGAVIVYNDDTTEPVCKYFEKFEEALFNIDLIAK